MRNTPSEQWIYGNSTSEGCQRWNIHFDKHLDPVFSYRVNISWFFTGFFNFFGFVFQEVSLMLLHWGGSFQFLSSRVSGFIHLLDGLCMDHYFLADGSDFSCCCWFVVSFNISVCFRKEPTFSVICGIFLMTLVMEVCGFKIQYIFEGAAKT